MKVHAIGSILTTACGRDLRSVSWGAPMSEVDCKSCLKTKVYKRLIKNH